MLGAGDPAATRHGPALGREGVPDPLRSPQTLEAAPQPRPAGRALEAHLDLLQALLARLAAAAREQDAVDRDLGPPLSRCGSQSSGEPDQPDHGPALAEGIDRGHHPAADALDRHREARAEPRPALEPALVGGPRVALDQDVGQELGPAQAAIALQAKAQEQIQRALGQHRVQGPSELLVGRQGEPGLLVEREARGAHPGAQELVGTGAAPQETPGLQRAAVPGRPPADGSLQARGTLPPGWGTVVGLHVEPDVLHRVRGSRGLQTAVRQGGPQDHRGGASALEVDARHREQAEIELRIEGVQAAQEAVRGQGADLQAQVAGPALHHELRGVAQVASKLQARPRVAGEGRLQVPQEGGARVPVGLEGEAQASEGQEAELGVDHLDVEARQRDRRPALLLLRIRGALLPGPDPLRGLDELGGPP